MNDPAIALPLRLRHHAALASSRALCLYQERLTAILRAGEPPRGMDSYVSVLRHAIDRVPERTRDIYEYALILARLLGSVGVDPTFRADSSIERTFERAAEVLAERGGRSADLRLAIATYYANISNGDARRLAMIEAAVREARDLDEQLRARSIEARYWVDVSRYEHALAILDACEQAAVESSNAPLHLADIYLTRGMVAFYRDHEASLRHLDACVRLATGALDTCPDVRRPLAGALHYIGRIHAAQGRYAQALDHMVASQSHRDPAVVERTQLGFHHLRLGETLFVAGNTAAAHDHFVEAGNLFATVRQRSTGEAQLNGALARVAAREGQRDVAERLLLDAITAARRDRYPRGELMLLFDLVLLRLRTGALIAAATGIGQGLVLWVRTELRSSARLTQQVRASLAVIQSTWRSRGSRPPTSTPLIACPCPRHERRGAPADVASRDTFAAPTGTVSADEA